MSGSGLVHLLLLHLEGTQVNWQGKAEKYMSVIVFPFKTVCSTEYGCIVIHGDDEVISAVCVLMDKFFGVVHST